MKVLVATEKCQRCAGSVQETGAVQDWSRESLISRIINYSRGVTTKGQEDSKNISGSGKKGRTKPGRGVPPQGWDSQLTLQPKRRQTFASPYYYPCRKRPCRVQLGWSILPGCRWTDGWGPGAWRELRYAIY